mgnify:CR=1 FL=1
MDEAIDNIDKKTAKLDLIREIKKSGNEVLQYIIRSSLSEKEALFLESALIDTLSFEKFNLNTDLSNIVSVNVTSYFRDHRLYHTVFEAKPAPCAMDGSADHSYSPFFPALYHK